MNFLLPFFLLAGANNSNQKALFTHILPALIPGSGPERLMFATLSAQKEIKTHADTEQGLLAAAIDAGDFKEPADLKKYPALQAAYDRLSPSAKIAVFAGADKR